MFGAAAACREKHRLQPCEPKPRPAEARRTRPAGFGTRISLIALSKPGTGRGSRNTASCKTAKNRQSNNCTQTTLPYIILLRHYAVSGLLNLQTTLTKAVTLVTPGGVADRPDAPGHLRGLKRKPLPGRFPAAVFGFYLRPSSQSALISCSTLLVLRTASAEAANLAASSFVRSIFTIFSIPLRPMIAGTPMQMSSWPYSPSR